MTVPVRKICTLYLVPRPTMMTDAFRSFTTEFYAALFITIITTSFILNVVNISNKEFFTPSKDEDYKSWQFCFVVVWGILFQSSYPNRSMDMGSGQRIIFLWVVFSMLVACCFSSQLVSNFTHPKLTPKPRTVEDLVNSGYRSPYYSLNPEEEAEQRDTASGIFSGIFNPEETLTKEWLRRSEPMGFDELVDALRTRTKQALFGYKFPYNNPLFIPGFTLRHMPDEVLAGYEMMDDCVRDVYTSIAVRDGSHVYSKLNKFLTYYKQFGLMKKHLNDDLEDLAKTYPMLRNVSIRSASSAKTRPLSLCQLQGVFVGLTIGLGAAIIVFLCEFVANQVQTERDSSIHRFRMNSSRKHNKR